ncbi:MAG: S-methyl-5-thioribose-1-phosphate isomerase [Atopobiaceae bacterium]|nr:S-methyl-5-thioribose-1-phosphate isomerase [Atopobiaceae bacterium]
MNLHTAKGTLTETRETLPLDSLAEVDTVALDDQSDTLAIIDQTKLPATLEVEYLSSRDEAYRAIKRLEVRGAPAIGVAAAIALYLDVHSYWEHLSSTDSAPVTDAEGWERLSARLTETATYLDSSRPTAVNLSWALHRMGARAAASRHAGDTPAAAMQALHDEAVAIRNEDVRVCRAIGEHGLSLLHDGDGILTHCNAGRLATVRYGTATAPIYLGAERGMTFHVWCDETRPLLQGARLTAFELMASGIDTCLECDNMSASLMSTDRIQAVFVGCDRVAANGDAANKIGTSLLALAAARHHVPVYVCAPTSTIDRACATGHDIRIEQRAPEEVTELWYERRMAPESVRVYNPAFDVTDADLIAGIVTEFGVARPPYTESLAAIFQRKETVERNKVHPE